MWVCSCGTIIYKCRSTRRNTGLRNKGSSIHGRRSCGYEIRIQLNAPHTRLATFSMDFSHRSPAIPSSCLFHNVYGTPWSPLVLTPGTSGNSARMGIPVRSATRWKLSVFPKSWNGVADPGGMKYPWFSTIPVICNNQRGKTFYQPWPSL